MPDWPQYIDLTKNKPPRKLLVRALEYVREKETALDLGAGALNDSKYLVAAGFKTVIAVDIEKKLELSNGLDKNIFIFKQIKIEDYDFPVDYFNLINAQFVLPFIASKEIGRVLDDILKSLRRNGIFTGQFFGINDDWRDRDGISCYSKAEIMDFFSGFEIIDLQEGEKNDQTALGGLKHWHLFHFIVKK